MADRQYCFGKGNEAMIKGDKVNLIPAILDDRQKVYEWCFQSETTKSHTGPPDYPEKPIATYEEFCDDYYEAYFFTGSKPNDGRGFLIANNEELVGFISYSSFHLKPGIAELDLWMNCEANCGKGFGVDAIISLEGYLNKTIGICHLLIAPSTRNTRAMKAYEKAGFQQSDHKMPDFLLDKYVSLYGSGDYGMDETALLIKEIGH